MPSAGSTVPSTSPAGTLTTKIISEVSVSTLTRMLKPRPKKALVSPRVHHGRVSGGAASATGGSAEGSVTSVDMTRSSQAAVVASCGSAGSTAAESATQPKMPPWAAIISRPTRWNSGK